MIDEYVNEQKSSLVDRRIEARVAACNAVQFFKHICNINTPEFSGIATAY